MLAQKKSFSETATVLSKDGGDAVRSNLDCMPSKRMDPLLLQTVAGLKLGQVSQPIDLDKGQALVMRTTDKYRREGFRLYEQGMYAQAEAMLLKDLELHPHSPEVWHLLAMCRSSLGKLNASVEAMDRALALQPGSAPILQDKATALASMGKENEALDLYQQALEMEPDNALVMSNMAWTLAKMNKQLTRAENLAKKSLQISPRNPRYWNTLGTVFSAQRRHAHALVCYYRASALDPSFPKVNQRILASFKDLSPSQISKLADIPLDLLEAPPEETSEAVPEKLPVDPLNPRFEPPMDLKGSPAKKAAAPKAQPSRISQKPAAPAISPEPTPPPVSKKPPVPLASLEPKPQAKPAAAKPAPAKPKPAAAAKPEAAPAKPEPVVAAKPEAAAAKPNAAQQDRVYSVQVGAFRTLEVAREQAKLWIRRGYTTYLEQFSSQQTGDWLRIMVGVYLSKPEARQVAHYMQNKRWIRNYFIRSRKLYYVEERLTEAATY